MESGYIYIMTNPSFPDYIKIGYADDVNQRLKQLNNSECVPFAFRLYAYYKVNQRLTDIKLHNMIDKLNPNLRSIDEINNKKRVREFYLMKPEDAYSILETIAEINSLKDNLVLVEPSKEEQEDEEEANINRVKRSVKTLPHTDWMIDKGLINIGDQIYVINHNEEIATIHDKKHVMYNNEIMSFNEFGCKVTGWKSIQCYVWMKIVGNDKTLAELREEELNKEVK